MADVPLVYGRFAAAFAAITAIGKTQTNQHHKYNFRGIDDVLNHLHGVLAEHELFYVPRLVDQAYEEWQTNNGKRLQVARVTYEFEFYTTDGSSLTVGPVVGQSADTDDKAPMQATSQSAKVALIHAFCIPTGDMGEGDSRSPMSEEGGRTAAQPKTFAVPTAEAQAALVDQLGAASIDEVQTKELCLLLSGGAHSTIADLDPQVFYALRNVAGWISGNKMKTAYTAEGVLQLQKPDGTVVDATKVVEAVQP